MEDRLALLEHHRQQLHLECLFLSVQLFLETSQCLIEHLCLLIEYLVHVLALLVLFLQWLHRQESLVNLHLQSLDLLLMHLNFFLYWSLSFFQSCDQDG